MAELIIRDLIKSYDKKRLVLQGLNLEVADGELLSVLGPSGCGKSTLLRLIAGLDKADGGEIRIDGRRVNDLAPKDRDIAMVFQNYALYPHMSVFDNIAVSMRLRRVGAEEIRRKVEETARRLEIEPYLKRYPRMLSGGERQRVALARALVRDPKLFLLDEPLSNLDALLREQARAQLSVLFREARATAVYVTHDQLEALSMSDRVGVLNRGRWEQIGTPEEIYARPATAFVAAFVGSPRMNLFPGSVIGDAAPTVGCRPEDVLLLESGEASGGSAAVGGSSGGAGAKGGRTRVERSRRQSGGMEVEMEVVLREPLGSRRLLRLRRGDLEIAALEEAEQPVAGPRLRVRFPANRLHRFDERGMRIPA